jgi:serine/threonine protein kinase
MTICGTDSYAAPEMLFQEDYCAAVDIFSLGMVLYEVIITNLNCYDDNNNLSVSSY